MATKLQELLSGAMLDTSGPPSRDTTLRRPTSVAPGAPLTIGAEKLLGLERPVSAIPKLVATPQQAPPQSAMPDDTIPISHLPSPILASETPEVVSVPTALQFQTQVPPLTKYSDDYKGR